MEYLAALTPPVVMAVAFGFLIRTLFRNQGGANASKEDAAAEAMAARLATGTPEQRDA